MIQEITQEKIDELSISSLPTRPNAPTASGGAGFSAKEMKNAFDALTLHVIEKYNQLVRAVRDLGEGSISDEILTGISEGHTLLNLFDDIKNGDFASYMKVGDSTLSAEINEIRATLETVKERLHL